MPGSLWNLLVVIALIATAIGVFSLNVRLVKSETENKRLRNDVLEAQRARAPYAQDPVADALRLLSEDFDKNRETIRILICQWGQIRQDAASSAFPEFGKRRFELRILHTYHPTWGTGASNFNTTIALLIDDAGELVDTVLYDSTISDEMHVARTITSNNNRNVVLSVAVGAPALDESGSFKHLREIDWETVQDGFVRRN